MSFIIIDDLHFTVTKCLPSFEIKEINFTTSLSFNKPSKLLIINVHVLDKHLRNHLFIMFSFSQILIFCTKLFLRNLKSIKSKNTKQHERSKEIYLTQNIENVASKINNKDMQLTFRYLMSSWESSICKCRHFQFIKSRHCKDQSSL